MKLLKRILLTIFILGIGGVLFRGSIYRFLVTYKSIGERTTYTATNKDLIKYIEVDEDFANTADIKTIVVRASSKTSSQLNYTTSKNGNDPNKLIESKTAHCVGYAAFFATTCNHLLKANDLDHEWVAKAQIGQLYFLGENIHHYFDSPFFKDHDFVTIENSVTGEIISVDPTIHDYLWIDFIRYVR
jgi:hypothetical protein